MSNYNSLKTTIDANIKQNGRQEITGQILNSVLNQIVTTLGAGYQFAGIATTKTDPGTPDAKVFYIANGKGSYTNFGSLEVTEDDVVVLYWDTAWHKVSTGIASQAKLSELGQEVIYDVSANNSGASFDSLSALLSNENLSTLIPVAVRCGGMSIRFMQTSDNKYVQYRLMSQTFSTTESNWQGTTNEVKGSSKDLVESGAVAEKLVTKILLSLPLPTQGYYNTSGSFTANGNFNCYEFDVEEGQIYYLNDTILKHAQICGIMIKNSSDNIVSYVANQNVFDDYPIVIPATASKMYISSDKNAVVQLFNGIWTIPNLEERLKEVEDNSVDMKEYSDYSFQTGYYLYEDGRLVSNGEFRNANIEVVEGDTFYYTAAVIKNNLVCVIAAFDDNGNYVKQASVSSFVDSYSDYKYIVPAGVRVISFLKYKNQQFTIKKQYSLKGIIDDNRKEFLDFVAVQNNVDSILPSTIYAVVGIPLCIYNDGIINGVDRGLTSPLNYTVEYKCNVGKLTSRGFYLNPSTTGTYTLTVSVYNDSKEKIYTKDVSLVVVSNDLSEASGNVVVVGDSTELGWKYTSPMNTKIKDLGGSISFIGTSKNNTLGVGDEAHSGASFGSFVSSDKARLRLGLSDGNTEQLEHGAIYTITTSLGTGYYEVGDVNKSVPGSYYTEGNLIKPGNVTTEDFFDSIGSTGVLSKGSGAGSGTLTYASKSLSYLNPFWNPNTGSLDMSRYKSLLGVAKIDKFMVILGINDAAGSNYTAIINNAITLYNFLASEADEVIMVLTTDCASDISAFGSQYGAGNSADFVAYKKNIFEIRKRLVDTFEDRVTYPKAKVVMLGGTVDRFYGYQRSEANVPYYQNESEIVFADAKHLNTAGQYQGAMTLLAGLVS